MCVLKGVTLCQELSLDVTVDQIAEELKFVKKRSEVKVDALSAKEVIIDSRSGWLH